MKLFDGTLTRVERSLDVRLLRHTVLAGNVANLDTPGYKPKDIDFASAMSAVMNGGEMARSDGGHLDAEGNAAGGAAGQSNLPGLRVIESGGASPSIDGNAVDLDRTMASLAENAIQYGASAKAATKKLGILRYAISEGNG